MATLPYSTGGRVDRGRAEPGIDPIRGERPGVGNRLGVSSLPPTHFGLDGNPHIASLLDGGADGPARHTVESDGRGQVGVGPDADDRQPPTETEDRGFGFPKGVERTGQIEGNRQAPLFDPPAEEGKIGEMAAATDEVIGPQSDGHETTRRLRRGTVGEAICGGNCLHLVVEVRRQRDHDCG